ncbi:hypothetical protein C8Q76DRAFT_633310 [Earliella scabrosa]|nr:hypothetical protein C8Q76DRAFT_633310 [Earliella scabrosa]
MQTRTLTPVPKELSSKEKPKATSKKTAACAGTSTPGAKGTGKTGSAKKLKFQEQFADVAVLKEQTRQKQLDVQLAKTGYEKLQLQAKLETKCEKTQMKLELTKLRMQYMLNPVGRMPSTAGSNYWEGSRSTHLDGVLVVEAGYKAEHGSSRG